MRRVLCLLFLVSSQFVYAQDPVAFDSSLWQTIGALQQQASYQKPGESHLMVVGLATFGFVSTNFCQNGITSRTNSFADADHYEFSPMFLWRQGKHMLMEFEPSYTEGSLGVNWADISYFVAPEFIARAGYFVLPFGIYNKRLAAGWIDKVASDPYGNNMTPGSDFGVELCGGFPLGSMKWSYDISVTNGLQLMQDGTLQSAGIVDNNKNKTFTGRLGLLPLSNSSLEIGVSGLLGKVGDTTTAYQNASTNMYAVDLSYIKKIRKFLLNVKGQYSVMKVDYGSISDSTKPINTFENKTTTAFAQVSLRPAYFSNKILKNFEVAFRYASLSTPNGSSWYEETTETDYGLIYWLSWRTALKFTFEHDNSTANAAGTFVNDKIYLQFSTEL